MLFILLCTVATLLSPISSLQAPESGFSSDPDFKLIRPYIYENTTTHILANVGDSVKFECYASGTPGATIKIEWSKPKYINVFEAYTGNLTLPNGREVLEGNILEFPSVKPEDAGSYDCAAYEEHTLPGSRSYLLSIKSMPIIHFTTIRKIFKESGVLNSIELSVGSSAVPDGEVVWHKNGQVLVLDKNYNVKPDYFIKGTSILTISTEGNEYSGNYTYIVQNELGSAEYSFVL